MDTPDPALPPLPVGPIGRAFIRARLRHIAEAGRRRARVARRD